MMTTKKRKMVNMKKGIKIDQEKKEQGQTKTKDEDKDEDKMKIKMKIKKMVTKMTTPILIKWILLIDLSFL